MLALSQIRIISFKLINNGYEVTYFLYDDLNTMTSKNIVTTDYIELPITMKKYLLEELNNQYVKKGYTVDMVDLSVYTEEQLEFPKENEVVRFIDRNRNIDFQAKITRVKKGKTSIDKTIEIERL